MSGLPSTWKELLADYEPVVTETIEGAADYVAEIESASPAILGLSRIYIAANDLASAVMVAGPATCQGAFQSYGRLLDAALAEIDGPRQPAMPLRLLGLCSYLNVAECSGVSLSDAAQRAFTEQMRQLGRTPEEFVTHREGNYAFAQLAFGTPLDEDAAADEAWRPGQTFQFNLPALRRYLAAALARAADPSDVEPAWRDFLLCFPYLLTANEVEWIDLLWLARLMQVRFHREPIGQTANRTRQTALDLPG